MPRRFDDDNELTTTLMHIFMFLLKEEKYSSALAASLYLGQGDQIGRFFANWVATFWATFSQIHLVTLISVARCQKL
jgi:hypothetical protein